jgi:two-component system LytT family sensor kinase
MDVDPETIRARVPNLILQPIVENAIRHGVSHGEDHGRIEIRARRVNGTLHLQVEDNGPGLNGSKGSGGTIAGGLGLANTQARLHNLYGGAHRFELTDAPGSGLVVTMQIPFEIAAPSRPDGAASTIDETKTADPRPDR